jgi:hypothetical protein
MIDFKYSAIFIIFANILNLPLDIDLLYLLQKAFINRKTLSKKELVTLLETIYPRHTANKNTISWKIHDLKQKGILSHQARGLYALGAKKSPFFPEISPSYIDLYTAIQKELPYTALSLTDTAWFNEFMLHQVFKTYLILEVEKEAAGTVFNSLIAKNKKAFLNPGKDLMENYVPNTDEAIIVKPLISESPLEVQGNVTITSLEKMLVDIVCDPEIYGAQYEEAEEIFTNAIDKYTINSTRIRRYARRRNREEVITRLLHKNKAI